MKILGCSIDVTKIDKSKIIDKDKDGKPFKNGAKYFNLDIIIKDEKDQFGKDVAIVIPQTKEQREAKEPRTYIGNGKTVFSTDDITSEKQPTYTKKGETFNANPKGANDDLPF